MDWLDALLPALGFVLALVAVIARDSLGVAVNDDFLEELLALGAIALALGPVLLRRKLFGAPKLPEPRQGPLWSLLSILGILTVMAGVGCMLMSPAFLSTALQARPDFAQQVRSERSAYDPRVTGVPDPLAIEHAARATRSEPQEVAFRQTRWEERRAEARGTALLIALVALLPTCCGTLCLRPRYPPRA